MIPYAEAVIQDGDLYKRCPDCGELIMELSDDEGEAETNRYGDHYNAVHLGIGVEEHDPENEDCWCQSCLDLAAADDGLACDICQDNVAPAGEEICDDCAAAWGRAAREQRAREGAG